MTLQRILLKAGLISVLAAVALAGCNSEQSNAETTPSQADNKQQSSSGSSCLIDFAKRPCELLSEEVLRAALPDTPAALEKHETKSAFSACTYSWPSGRKKSMEIMGRSMEVADDNQISLSWIKQYKKNPKDMFRRAYLPTENEQKQAQEMFNKQMNKKTAELNLDAQSKKAAKQLLGTAQLSMQFSPVDGVGSMASWENSDSGSLYVLDGDTKFQIVTNVSAESSEDRSAAVTLAKAVLDTCK